MEVKMKWRATWDSETMENILKAGVTFVVLAMVLVIGAGVNVLTNTTVTGLVGAGSIAGNVANSANIAIVTFTNFLPVLAIAVVGGVAIAYIVGFFGGTTRT
jgi:hypothetical protein